jgi:hypothetical protein
VAVRGGQSVGPVGPVGQVLLVLSVVGPVGDQQGDQQGICDNFLYEGPFFQGHALRARQAASLGKTPSMSAESPKRESERRAGGPPPGEGGRGTRRVAHDGHKGMAQFTGRPVLPELASW